jgi:hypothetical protein
MQRVLKLHISDWNYIQTFISMSEVYWSTEDLEYLFSELRGIKKRKEPILRIGVL